MSRPQIKATLIISLLIACTLVISALAGPSQLQAPDLVFFNGKIFTSDAAHPYVQALAIRGERITATGDSAKIRALIGPHTKQIDLGGRTVIPGINDAHYHLGVTPANEFHLQFKNSNPTLMEVSEAISATAPKWHEGTIIHGYIGPSAYVDPELNRDFLDKLVPDHPIILTTVSGHASILNSAALAKFGVNNGEADPLGGKYERTPDGRLTGVLREYAEIDLERKLSDLTSDADAVKELAETLSAAAQYGITSIQDMSNAIAPERCLALLGKIPSPIRVRIIRMPGSTPNGRDTREGLSVLHYHSGLVTVSGSKWMLDGTPLEGTFATRQAQADLFAEIGRAKSSGAAAASLDHSFAVLGLTFPREQLPMMLHESLKEDDQLILHVSGYPSAAAMLDAMQSSGGKATWAGRRVRFEHGDGLFPDLLPRVKEMGIIVVQNPAHLGHGFRTAEARQLRSILAADIPLALGSDSGGGVNPYLDIMFASTCPDRPSEAITREQAVIAYTLTSAYAEFAEKEKGSLVPGKLADLAVLSQDIFSVPAADLPKTESVLTLVGGKIVYDAGVLR